MMCKMYPIVSQVMLGIPIWNGYACMSFTWNASNNNFTIAVLVMSLKFRKLINLHVFYYLVVYLTRSNKFDGFM